jgi:hypothetical protein
VGALTEAEASEGIPRFYGPVPGEHLCARYVDRPAHAFVGRVATQERVETTARPGSVTP